MVHLKGKNLKKMKEMISMPKQPMVYRNRLYRKETKHYKEKSLIYNVLRKLVQDIQ